MSVCINLMKCVCVSMFMCVRTRAPLYLSGPLDCVKARPES